MRTLTVDDRKAVVSMMNRILERIDPRGQHTGLTDPQEALNMSREKPFDVAFLDIEMPEMSGIELAEKLQDIHNRINIVFITGHQEYMPQAFALYASGYITKPVTEQAVRDVLEHLRFEIRERPLKPVKVQCFGNFEAFCDEKPIRFSRSKSKELMAYLVDRRGALCSVEMIIATLWPEEDADKTRKSMARTAVMELAAAFDNIEVEDILIRESGGVGINVSLLDCDYYRYLEGDAQAEREFIGEYMTQYEFASETRANLQAKLRKE